MGSAAKPASSDGFLLTKWSSKPARGKIERARNNQRRHRERVKCHVADLESRLAQTQLELQKALSTIDGLRREAEECQPSTSASDNENTTSALAKSKIHWANIAHYSPILSSQPSSTLLPQVSASIGTLLLRGASNVEEQNAYEVLSGDEQGSACLQPPDPEESTTRCRDAYRLIADLNYQGLESSTLHKWLQPGFRSASAKDDSCRVENKLLFALLDYVSS